MRLSAIILAFTFCVGIAHAQRFESHKVYLTNNGIGSRTVKVNSGAPFSIKKDNRYSWAKYKIGNGEVTFSASANSTTNNRSCDFVLTDKNGNPVDTLELIQAAKVSATTVKSVSKTIGSTSSTKAKSTTTTTRKGSTTSSRSSYGGQCAATTKKAEDAHVKRHLVASIAGSISRNVL